MMIARSLLLEDALNFLLVVLTILIGNTIAAEADVPGHDTPAIDTGRRTLTAASTPLIYAAPLMTGLILADANAAHMKAAGA